MTKTNPKAEWLSVLQVAALMGVHPSTIRQWSDKGILPTHRTTGGHRRYRQAEIDLWRETAQQRQESDPLHAIQAAIGQIRMQIGEGKLESEPWYAKLDEHARAQYRQSGILLVRGLMAYMASEDPSDDNESYALGYEYASRGHRYGLRAVEAAHAFLFFRNTLLEAFFAAYDQARVPPGAAWGRMLSKMHAFTDKILLHLLETYDLMEGKGGNG